MEYRTTLGMLNVLAVGGKEIKGRSMFSVSPYITFQIDHIKKKTKVSKGKGKNPKWNDLVEFEIIKGRDVLNGKVMGKEISEDEFIGDIKVDLKPIFQKGYAEMWVPVIHPHKNRHKGDVFLKLQYKPAEREPEQVYNPPPPRPAPAPMNRPAPPVQISRSAPTQPPMGRPAPVPVPGPVPGPGPMGPPGGPIRSPGRVPLQRAATAPIPGMPHPPVRNGSTGPGVPPPPLRNGSVGPGVPTRPVVIPPRQTGPLPTPVNIPPRNNPNARPIVSPVQSRPGVRPVNPPGGMRPIEEQNYNPPIPQRSPNNQIRPQINASPRIQPRSPRPVMNMNPPPNGPPINIPQRMNRPPLGPRPTA